MEKAREERAAKQKELGIMKRSLHEQQAFLTDLIDYMRNRSCTPSEDKARKVLMRTTKLRLAKINQKINDLNTQIWKLNEESRGDLKK